MRAHKFNPLRLAAVTLFGLTGLATVSPMAGLVDCNDSFWATACAEANPDRVGTLIDPGAPVLIDNSPTCQELANSYLLCET